MYPSFDVVIAGAGLAGAAAALYLSETQRVIVLEAARPSAGASGAAAGLVNPLMGRKAKRTWQADAALDALHETLDRAGAASLFSAGGVVRPAMTDKQVRFFEESGSAHPEHGSWFAPEAAAERFPWLPTPRGALLVRRGGAIHVPNFVAAMLEAARANGADVQSYTRVTGWTEATDGVRVRVEHDGATDEISTKRLLLAIGWGLRRFPAWADLDLRGVKGQTVRVRRPPGLTLERPISGRGYAVPDGKAIIVGSSYEHDFNDVRPSPEQTDLILQKADQMLPGLAAAEVLDATAGVRIMTRSNRPLLGPLPGAERVWVFTGLGSRGLLSAPLLARRLPECLDAPETLPRSIVPD
jgi:glycine oxidase